MGDQLNSVEERAKYEKIAEAFRMVLPAVIQAPHLYVRQTLDGTPKSDFNMLFTNAWAIAEDACTFLKVKEPRP